MPTRISILGLGLMGGSLGLALRRARYRGTVTGFARREETRREALACGAVDEVFDTVADAVAGASLVVACVPILSTAPLIEGCRGHLGEGAVVTDVGSTKREVTEAVTGVLRGTAATFVGSHPIAGSQRTGIEAATPTLYEGSVVVVTAPDGQAAAAPVADVRALWERVGGQVTVTTPERHDGLLARTSHLPHVVASLLASTVGREDAGDEFARFCGTGFLDTTRIAEGSPAVWLDILRTNRVHVLREIEAFAAHLETAREYLRGQDHDALKALLATGKTRREQLAGDPRDLSE